MQRRLMLLVAVGLILAACGGGSLPFEDGNFGGSQSAPDAGFTATTVAASAEMETPSGEDTTSTGDRSEGGGTALVSPDGRQIIYTATVAIAVDDVAGSVAEAIRQVEALGGFIADQSSQTSPESVTVLTFKVTPDRFRAALDALAGIGDLRSQTIASQDVTARVIDLESRIETAEASVGRLRSLIAEASDIEDIVALERELLAREAELESWRAQLRGLEDAVALATIELTISETFARPGIQLVLTGVDAETGAVGSACPGRGSASVPEGGAVTLCVEARNVGDTPLADLTFTDTVLGLDNESFTVVFGTLDQPLEPGQSVMLAHRATIDRTISTRTRVVATPLGPEGTELTGRSAQDTQSLGVQAVRPPTVPGFMSGFRASIDALTYFWRVAVVITGFALPLLVVLGAVVAVVVALVRMRRRSAPTVTEVIDVDPIDESAEVTPVDEEE